MVLNRWTYQRSKVRWKTFGGCPWAWMVLGALLFASSAVCPTGIDAAGTALERMLGGQPDEAVVPVIVRFRTPPDTPGPIPLDRRVRRIEQIRRLRARAAATENRWHSRLTKAQGLEIRSLWMIHGLALKAPVRLICDLLRDPEVESLRLDALVALPPPPRDGTLSRVARWNLDLIRAPDLWAQGFSGQGVVVATLDSGVDVNHPDLRDRWRGGVNSWFDPNGEHLEPFDQDGHGTQTMGILVGGDASGEAIGVAPDARWIAAKIYNDLGIATLSGIHEAFQWLLDPDGDSLTDDAPSLVVCPWGVDVALDRCEPEFHPDIQALKTAGIAVVFAAGNDGPGIGTSSPPANAPGSLAAGAVDSSATVATFSSRGPSACGGGLYPQLAAPGVNVKTADLTAGGVFPNSYRTVSGTSYAAPHIGGALALLQSALPQTDPDQLEAALFRSAMDVGSAGPDFSTGYGIVDVVAAYADLMAEPVCADADSDGFFAEPGCGTPVDCDDRDAAVHPGATEMAQDGVDQDCNGFDLTIKVRRAVYFTRTQVLKVMATSDLRGEAGLSVSGFGAMHFQGGRTWSMILQGVQTNPSSITVTGIEGAHVVQVQPRPRPRGGGLAWASHW